MLEYVIVGLIVAAAAFYTVRKYMPAAWRKKLAYRVGGSESTLGRLVNADPGCGSGCDTCKSCADPAPAPEGEAEGEGGNVRRIIKIHKP